MFGIPRITLHMLGSHRKPWRTQNSEPRHGGCFPPPHPWHPMYAELPAWSSNRLTVCSVQSPKQPLPSTHQAVPSREFFKVLASSSQLFGGKSNGMLAHGGWGRVVVGEGRITRTTICLRSAPGPHHSSSRTGRWPLDCSGTRS